MKIWLLRPLILIWAFLVLAEADELAVITSVHSDFSQIHADNLRNLYLGREKFVGKQSVQVIDYKNAQGLFLEQYIRKKKKAYTRLWHMMVFTGKSLAPKEFKTEEELYEFIAKNKNIIGYTIQPVEHKEIKVLKVVR